MTNGIVDIKKLGSATVEIDLIPKTNQSARPGYSMKPEFITIHNTANSAPTANAQMHTDYVDNQKGNKSWHFTVDDNLIFQELPINENGWHAGDGNGKGNRASIGIEICEYKGQDWFKARSNSIALVVYLLKSINLTPDKVKPHQHWSGKYCPHIILDEGWGKYVQDIQTAYDVFDKPPIDNDIVADWAKESWDKAKNMMINGVPLNDGIGPKNPVTEEQLMVFLDRLGLIK